MSGNGNGNGNGKILGIDYGEARTGLALSDYTGLIATPLTVLTDRNMDWLVKRIGEVVTEHEVVGIVVGNPLNMDGTVGEKSLKCETLAVKLRDTFSAVQVKMFDERLSTVEAHEIRRSNASNKKKRSQNIDAVAAAVILQSYLEQRQNNI